jgi:hypothetical protein
MSSPSLPPPSTVDTGLLYQLLGETRATFNRSTVQPGPALKAQQRACPPSGVGAAGAAAVFNRPAPVARPPLVSLPAAASLLNLERHADSPVVFAVSRSINAAAGAVQKIVQRSSAPVGFPPSTFRPAAGLENVDPYQSQQLAKLWEKEEGFREQAKKLEKDKR